MSLIPSSEVMKQVFYDSVLTTGGALAVAFAALKIFGERMGVPMSSNGIIMFTIAVFLGNLLVRMLQNNKWIKEDL